MAVSVLSSISARNKGTCNLTGKCFEMPNVSYTLRYASVIYTTIIGKCSVKPFNDNEAKTIKFKTAFEDSNIESVFWLQGNIQKPA